MFDSYWNRIEAAIEDKAELERLVKEVEKAKGLTDPQREQLLGLADRYLEDHERAREAGEIAEAYHPPAGDARA